MIILNLAFESRTKLVLHLIFEKYSWPYYYLTYYLIFSIFLHFSFSNHKARKVPQSTIQSQKKSFKMSKLTRVLIPAVMVALMLCGQSCETPHAKKKKQKKVQCGGSIQSASGRLEIDCHGDSLLGKRGGSGRCGRWTGSGNGRVRSRGARRRYRGCRKINKSKF